MKTAKIFFAFCVVIVAARIQLVAGEPRPADLIDLETIRNLTLSDLGWQEESRQATDGVLVLRGSWTGPIYRGTDASGAPAVGELNEVAKVRIPLARPASTEVAQIVWGAHEPQNVDSALEANVELPRRLPVAVLLHGQKPEDWSTRGFSGRPIGTRKEPDMNWLKVRSHFLLSTVPLCAIRILGCREHEDSKESQS